MVWRKPGASVMIGDVRADLGQETANAIAKTGVTAGFVELDVTDDKQWEKAVSATVAKLGGYDILINNAGVEITSLIVDIKAEDARRMCDINVVGVVLGMKHAFRAMRPEACRRQRRRGRQYRRWSPPTSSRPRLAVYSGTEIQPSTG